MGKAVRLRGAIAIATLTSIGACTHPRLELEPTPPAVVAEVPVLLRQTGVPSLSVAKVEKGRVAWAAAWGRQSDGIPATPKTLYNVASLTKPISAEVVLRAAARGRLRLNEPMAPWWVDPDIAGDPRHLRLTPRLALTHRTGFPNWRYETAGKLVFKNDPDAKVGYSGEGFQYLARYAERRTGSPFERLAEKLVFQPAGMRDTSYTRRAWFAGRIAVPTDGEGRALEPVIADRFTAADDLYATATDYARFLAGVAGGSGLDRELAADRERIQVSTLEAPCPGGPGCADAAGWGLGWEVAVFGRDRVLWHTGADRGEFAFAYVIPRTGEGAVILTNSVMGYKIVLPILERIGTHPRFLTLLRAQAG